MSFKFFLDDLLFYLKIYSVFLSVYLYFLQKTEYRRK